MLRDAVPLGECGRALVVKLRHHGDVLLAAPVLTTLKSHAPMFDGHPALSELHVVGRNWKALGAMERFSREMELFGRLRARRYDLLVHLSEQPRGAWLARTLGARYSVAPAMPGRGRFWAKSFTHLYPVVGGGRRHQVELNLDALRRVGVQPSLADRKVVFVPGKQAEAKASRLAPEGFIHMHPASRWTFKCWPAEKNAELIDRFASEGHQVVLTSSGDPAELDMVQKIVALSRAKTISTKELGALTARARLFVGVDSMPMHLAAAMGTPTVALFGPSGENEWGPWNVERRIVTTVHTCRPCGLDGCGGGKVSECLSFLPVDAVHAAARELLA